METNKPTISRRDFVKLTGISGVMLALGFSFPAIGSDRNATIYNFNAIREGGDIELNPFVIIQPDGIIKLIAHKPEMGQGTYQSMPMLVAEELEVDLNKVIIEMAKGDAKYDKHGGQTVGGSYSVRGGWEPLRKMGAAARMMLIAAAAEQWNTTVENCYAEDGKVINRTSGTSLSYADLVNAASKLEVPKEIVLKTPEQFKLIGKSLPRQDVPMKVNGTAQFGIDVKVPGMLYASIERSPVFYGKVGSFDETKAKAVKGVKHVLYVERKLAQQVFHGVAVVADTYYGALQGRKALNVKWENGEYTKNNSVDLSRQYREDSGKEGVTFAQQGDFAAAFESAVTRLEAEYELPFAAHAPMEPQNAVVHVQADRCEVWAPTQVPANARKELAAYLNLPIEQITVHVTFLGGAFGRRLFSDFILEAASISKSAGAPIKVVWTREDDMTQGPFRPGTFHTLKAGFDKDRNPVAFLHKITGPSISMQLGYLKDKSVADRGAMECIHTHYNIANQKTVFVLSETEVPLGWWRSVYSSTNAFAQEGFVDEIAQQAGRDPMAFRLELLKEQPKFIGVLQLLAEKAQWNEPLPKGWGKGVAIAECFGSVCGHVVKISKGANGKLKIEKVIAAIDCGTTINPDNVKAQTEGNIIMALTAALKDEIVFENGRAKQANFNNYRMLRINETPEIEVHIVPSTNPPGGVGEPGLPALAPALASAIFNLTGKRIRKLPFKLDEIS